MEGTSKIRPSWWHVFVADLRIRVSRFRFLGKFKFIMPFLLVIIFFIQFILFIALNAISESSTMSELALYFDDYLFKVEASIISFLIFLGFSSSVSYFATHTEKSELEIISSSPISTKSYLFGKFLSIQINNLIFIPVIIFGHFQIGRLAGIPINWFYLIFYALAISVLYFSLCWLGLTIGPRFVVKTANQSKEMGRRMDRTTLFNLFVALQFTISLILVIVLDADLFRRIFIFLPQGWFAVLGSETFLSTNITLIPSLFGLLAIAFGSIFVVITHFRLKYSLDLENIASLTGGKSMKTHTPKALKIIDKLKLPYNYSFRTFYLINYRKSIVNRIVDYIFILATIGIIIVGLLFDQYDWSTYVFFGAIGVAAFSIFYAAIDGVQLLFGGRNTFLVSQSAPNGIRKMLSGKVMQMLYTYSIEYICIFILLMVFQTNKLNAFLMTATIIAATFSGLTLGLLSLSIAPFFETSDISSNPLRGLQLTLPLNVSFVYTGGIIVGFYMAFWPHLSWLLFLLLLIFEVASGIGYFFLADKLFQRFQP
ncbi:MAG: hypothetical protein ACTSO7_04225 [Candidatus Heimdallarchaeota archaeon]